MRTPRPQHGFSLIELVMVIMIVAIAGVTVLGSFGQVGQAILVADDVQAARGSAEVCGERILRGRRDGSLGYDGITTTVCVALPLASGFSRSVSVTPVTSATLSACPAGVNCKQVTVAVQEGAKTVASLDLLVVEY